MLSAEPVEAHRAEPVEALRAELVEALRAEPVEAKPLGFLAWVSCGRCWVMV